MKPELTLTLIIVAVLCWAQLSQLSAVVRVKDYHDVSSPLRIINENKRGDTHGDDIIIAATTTKYEIGATVVAEKFPILDIISVGQIGARQKQEAQRQTMGAHASVRRFYAATEMDDFEYSCHLNLTQKHVAKIKRFCRSQTKEGNHSFLRKLAPVSFNYKKLSPGWVCAQKRPLNAFKKWMDELYNGTSASSRLPDYLMIVDDDTWLNIPEMISFMTKNYPPNQPYAVAGCLIRMSSFSFTIPFGGYGTFFTRAALQRWLIPLDCRSNSITSKINSYEADTENHTNNRLDRMFHHDFELLACWRLKQDLSGERALFRNGMTLMDLMHAYVTHQPFLQVSSWSLAGSCMHSDWAWGYFVNYYHVAVHANHVHYKAWPLQHDRFVGYQNSQLYMGKHFKNLRQLCLNNNDASCSSKEPLCHGISPGHMHFLYNQTLLR